MDDVIMATLTFGDITGFKTVVSVCHSINCLKCNFLLYAV